MSIEPVGRKTRRGGRSRKYPAESLDRVIERARVVYEKEGRNTAPVIEVVRHWGYNNHTSGAASTAYSAVRQFGLIEEEGRGEERMATLTDLAFEILRAPDPTSAIGQAMLTPGVHKEMWQEYGPELPSERTLHWKLVRERGFTETGATEFLKQYKESLAFAMSHNALDALLQEEEQVDTAIPVSSEPSAVAPRAYGGGTVQDVWRESESGAFHYVSHPGPPPSDRLKRHSIPLAGGKQVILEGDFPLTEAAWRQFLIVLEAFKPGLVEDEPAPSAAASASGPPSAPSTAADSVEDA